MQIGSSARSSSNLSGVGEDGGGRGIDGAADPRAPWRHVQRLELLLRNATSIDAVARAVLTHLAELPDVTRVGIGLTEGAGRRLRFVASESTDEPELVWCHIDAYDDVPLTTVTRTGEDVFGTLDQLEGRFAAMVDSQREAGVCALATVALPGVGSPLGGLIVFYDTDAHMGEPQRRLLHAAARRTADAVRRVMTVAGTSLVDPPAADDAEPAGWHGRIELDGEPRAASAVRRFLREQLGTWGIDDDTIDSAELCASELVNNVIMHARSAFQLNAHLENGVLTVTCRDVGANAESDGAAHAPVVDDDAMRVFGRGLTLVDAIADRWGSDHDAGGTIAWFVLEPHAGPSEPARTG